MFNVESAERVELGESLLTWVCEDGRVAGRPPPSRPPFRGPPMPVAGGERRGQRCRHIRALGRAEPGRAASTPAPGRGSLGSGGARVGPGLEGDLSGLGVGRVEANDGVQAAL